MFAMMTTSFRGAVGMAILYAFAAAAGAVILVSRIVEGTNGFGVLAGAAILFTFGILTFTYVRNALRLRREGSSQVASASAASPQD